VVESLYLLGLTRWKLRSQTFVTGTISMHCESLSSANNAGPLTKPAKKLPALDILVLAASITVQFAVVVGSWQRKAHGQQKALTVATTAHAEQNSRNVGQNGPILLALALA